ncbi:MAG: metalloregulator ArsR/SmtB family transcription factor [Candidatus Sulfotelmatobacter sp.]
MIHERMIEVVARRFHVLGEPYRLRILQQLQPGPKTVGQIVCCLDGNQPNVSRHLQILFDAGLVGRERAGNSIYYSIADPMVFELCDLVCRSTAQRAARVQRLLSFRGSRSRTGRARVLPVRGGN